MRKDRERRLQISDPTIVAIPDTHFPFSDKPAIDKLLAELKAIQPEYVVQMGDLYDLYNFSSHATSRLGLGPMEELTEGRGQAEAMWAGVRDAVPNAKCFQILGNHDLRIRKQLVKKAPEMEALLEVLDIDSLWRFAGVKLQADYREPLEISGIVFHHGFGKAGSHVRRFLRPTVVGHLHIGRVEYLSLWDRVIWELGCGFLGDSDALAFSYTPTRLANWQTGFGLIDERGPRFVSL